MNKAPRWFQIFVLTMTLAMAWANHRGYMVSALFNDSGSAQRSASGHASHK
jgi:hypothetical protein